MIKLGVIYGGMSTESEISKKSAKSVLANLNREKYDISKILIEKDGIWYEDNNEKRKIENIVEYLKKFDVIFPVLHGLYGEDGSIQGMLKLINVKFVGCGILASSIGMDKSYTKIIFDKANINQAKYIYLKNERNRYIYINENMDEIEVNEEEIEKIVVEKLHYPVFIKPANSGSSVGVNKATNKKELLENIKIAVKYDGKILIEAEIVGKEVECAVLGNNFGEIEVTEPGEILPAEDFYSFDAKYNNVESKTKIPAGISREQSEEIKKLAKKAFRAIDGNGISRIDFFVENSTGKVYINEINTMPGFTEISMYPKLFEDYGYTYSELLDKLIETVIE